MRKRRAARRLSFRTLWALRLLQRSQVRNILEETYAPRRKCVPDSGLSRFILIDAEDETAFVSGPVSDKAFAFQNYFTRPKRLIGAYRSKQLRFICAPRRTINIDERAQPCIYWEESNNAFWSQLAPQGLLSGVSAFHLAIFYYITAPRLYGNI